MLTFDAGSGEVCQIRRVRTNTPLQALVTLNDVPYIEAAGALAKRMQAGGETLDARIAHGLQLVLIREAEPREVARLAELYKAVKPELENPAELLAAADAKDADPALVAVANVILNLDETVMKP